MWRNTRQIRAEWQANALDQLAEHAVQALLDQRRASRRHKHMVIPGRKCLPLRQILLKGGTDTVMQYYQTALAKLGVANEQAVGCNVRLTQPDGFRYPQAGAGEQAEQGAVGRPKQRVLAVTPCRLQQ